MSASPLLEIRELSLTAGKRVLVDRLSLRVHAGDVWAIVGPNGAGKTMLLNAVAGLRPPARGMVLLAGEDVRGMDVRVVARQRAYLPQALHDAFSATVLDVVMLGRHPYMSRWTWEGERERASAMEALRTVDLADLASRDVMTLSGGERQRVGIAGLLLQEAPLLLLDEPVAHLDLHHQVSILAYLSGLVRQRRRAIVFSVHDLNLAARFATHVMLYRGDGCVECGPVDEILTEEAISKAFRYPVQQARFAGRTVFIPS